MSKNNILVKLSNAGILKNNKWLVRDVDLEINKGQIVTLIGPNGSGKTTTLYAGLRHLSDSSQNILTVEDPIEYTLKGIGQTQVNLKTGYNFAVGLRSMLRPNGMPCATLWKRFWYL